MTLKSTCDKTPSESGISEAVPFTRLIGDVRRLIEDAKTGLSVAVNSALTLLYWRIGKRVRDEVLNGQRAEYGEQIVAVLSQQLEREYGRGFSQKSLRHMIRFAESFPDTGIVSTLSRQLSWSHFREIIYLKDPSQRDFYAGMCRLERWSVRTLHERVTSMLYERTALSKQSSELVQQELSALRGADRVSPDLVLKDPYILDFLGLQDRYLEKNLEDAIVRELESFLLELGVGFTFVERQKRLS